ncbi:MULTISPECIES: Na(+)/H(+) antiporter subunit B [Bacillaceae]|uniref:Cation:proton antiporter n=2 Tax=Bacillus infantis TaxID=324767 RepID=U5LEW4_9BACI|nr:MULTISPECIES: Na(+)/H(+) antiporter subunit B [Bacillus]AGX06000.1 cation:proton antiporter [Bacillus infantis NRRL B-14911]EAR64155.1 MrpB [Bacillus sp. NRRL B-14911]MCK6207589.1 Na(+)/H(+) antiporter subunit B [Bacillus infantis]MDT0162392.1 Na(+)/H(+) antiporter subunit B [Bacillus sp. AG4(2022)]MDW2879767.1 Na(+)/H(+) antiporter subunit B [Bacillus infantis]
MKTNDIILQTVTKVALFIIILFSIHLFFAGHYYPGGGFVGGLMTSGAIVLLLLAFDMKTVANILPIDYKYMIATGLLFAVGTGAGALLFNVPFLTHAFNDVYLPLLGKTSLHTAVLFDTGVFLVVVGVTMTIIQTIGEDE